MTCRVGVDKLTWCTNRKNSRSKEKRVKGSSVVQGRIEDCVDMQNYVQVMEVIVRV